MPTLNGLHRSICGVRTILSIPTTQTTQRVVWTYTAHSETSSAISTGSNSTMFAVRRKPSRKASRRVRHVLLKLMRVDRKKDTSRLTSLRAEESSLSGRALADVAPNLEQSMFITLLLFLRKCLDTIRHMCQRSSRGSMPRSRIAATPSSPSYAHRDTRTSRSRKNATASRNFSTEEDLKNIISSSSIIILNPHRSTLLDQAQTLRDLPASPHLEP